MEQIQIPRNSWGLLFIGIFPTQWDYSFILNESPVYLRKWACIKKISYILLKWRQDKVWQLFSTGKKKEMKPSPLSKSSRKRQKQHVYDKVKTRPGLELTSLVWGPQHLLQVIRHRAVKLRELEGITAIFHKLETTEVVLNKLEGASFY